MDLMKDKSSGMSRYAIAKKHKISVSTISQRLINLGFPKAEFTNLKEWKIMTLSNDYCRHIAIGNGIMEKLGYKRNEKLLYKSYVKNGRIIIEVKKV